MSADPFGGPSPFDEEPFRFPSNAPEPPPPAGGPAPTVSLEQVASAPPAKATESGSGDWIGCLVEGLLALFFD